LFDANLFSPGLAASDASLHFVMTLVVVSARSAGRTPKSSVPTSLFFPGQAVLNSSVFPMSSKPKPRETELNFEGAMDRLEKIVEQMESGKLPLEDLIVRYEEGMNLVKVCQERLANAEQKIEIIARNSAGKAVVKEFEPTQEPATPEEPSTESESTNDEIKLF
jgi:exodeoxyribonuclease VII small subunit